MYYRRKIILALLEEFGGTLSRTDLQKYLFLFTRKQEQPAFDFMPYHYGCYSAQAAQDLSTMHKLKLIESAGEGVTLRTAPVQIKPDDQMHLQATHARYKHLRGKSLLHHVYTDYPFYAIQSKISGEILSEPDRKKVQALIPKKRGAALFTIGYEGISVENYITKLIKEDVRILCDVRKNPVSMKFGFSKKQLKGLLEGAGIDYLHLPGLGIESQERRNLKTKTEFQKLFSEYEKTTLVRAHDDLFTLNDALKKYKRIALTCFEADAEACHRKRTAAALNAMIPETVRTVHL